MYTIIDEDGYVIARVSREFWENLRLDHGSVPTPRKWEGPTRWLPVHETAGGTKMPRFGG